MSEWHKTNFRGVEYRKHKTRKHGVKYDRYFRGRFMFNGKPKSVGLGWASDGWTEEKAALKLKNFRENMKTGAGPTSIKEEEEAQREQAEKDRLQTEQARIEAERIARENITVSEFWHEHYFPQAKIDKKTETVRAEERNFRLWIAPIIGELPIKELRAAHIEQIKHKLFTAQPQKSKKKNHNGEAATKENSSKQGRSMRLIEYCLAITRQIINKAKQLGYFDGENPVGIIKKPKVSNERKRFLTHAEGAQLLKELKSRSEQLHDISLLSLRCGLRAGEIFNLTWADIDFPREQILIRDPKAGRDRHAYMTSDVKEMLQRRKKFNAIQQDLIFTDRNNNKLQSISNSFDRAIEKLGWNKGIDDPKHKLCFHSLRHSFASQLVENNTPLPVVKELLGHATLKMTERYAHVGEGLARQAIQNLNKNVDKDNKNEK